jgi:tetratricopeptide (TPR) repeat protein
MKKLIQSMIILFLLFGSVCMLAAQESDSKAERLTSAKALYQHGKWDEAAAAYKAILADDPKSIEARVWLSRALLKKQDVAGALETAKKAVELGAGSADAHVALGEVYFRKAMIPEAEREFVEGLKIDVTNGRAFMGRAKVFRAESLYKRAHDFIIQAQKLDPMDPEIRRYWHSTLKPAEQLEELEKYLAHPHDDEPDETANREAYRTILKEQLEHPDKKCKLVTKVEQTSIPLEKFLDGPNWFVGIGLKPAINGHRSMLLLDTGASGITLSPKAAEKAGIKAIAHGTMEGVGDKGPVGRYIGRADSIKIGNLEFQNCMVDVAEKKSTLDIDGLIGADVFDKYLITVDIPGQVLTLSQLPMRPGASAAEAKEPEPQHDVMESDSITNDSSPQDRYVAPAMANFSTFYRFGHIMLLPTGIEDAPPKLFLVDTGAYNTLITPEAAREVTKVNGDWTTRVKGISGNVDKVYLADHARIRFSHFRQENQGIMSFDMSSLSKSVGTEVSGILGFALFNMMKMTIDYRDGLIDFQYVPRSRDPHF